MRTRTLLTVTAVLAGPPATAQVDLRFSIDEPSVSVGTTGFDGIVIDPGSVLFPQYEPQALGPLNKPLTRFLQSDLGLSGPFTDVDALSAGRDARPGATLLPGRLLFSVDRISMGIGGVPWGNMKTEWPQASSDGFVNVMALPVPADSSGPGDNAIALDGDGMDHPSTGHQRSGLGIDEFGDPADAVDGIDDVAGVGGSLGQLFFSLNAAAGMAHGALAADVLCSNLSGSFSVYASATTLGLDPVYDDIDALAIWDNGDGVYSPSSTPFTWGPGLGDMLLYSVRRTSSVVGTLDSQFGLPIQPGDVLTTPAGGAPAIVIAAERLGLKTDRSNLFSMDDLDALDILIEPLLDCDANDVEDVVDIATGLYFDTNRNGYPDPFEAATNYCTAGVSAWGCQGTLSTAGYASATAASGFVVTANNVNGNVLGMFFFGISGPSGTPWGTTTSFKCVLSPTKRTPLSPSSGVKLGCGSMSRSLNAIWCPTCPSPGKNPGFGATVQLQAWYRDPDAVGPTKTAMSDAIEFKILP